MLIVHGTDSDGIYTLVLGVVGFAFALGTSRTANLGALLVAITISCIGIYEAVTTTSNRDIGRFVTIHTSVAAGIYVLLGASVVAAFASLIRQNASWGMKSAPEIANHPTEHDVPR